MAVAKAWALLLAATLLAPLASAADAGGAFQAESLTLVGSTTLDGDASALFAILRDPDAVSWRLTAQSGTLTRDYLVEAAVDHPLDPDVYLYSHELDSGTRTRDLGAVTLHSAGGQPGGALLARGALRSTVSSEGLVLVESVTDPTVAQFGEADVGSGEGVGIQETLPGELLDLEVARGVATLRGDMVLTLFGPWYAIEEGGATTDERSGEYESQRNGPAAQVHQEMHTLTLVGAVLEVTFGQPLDLFATYATADVVGTIEAVGPAGDAGSSGSPVGASDPARGATVLQLTSAAGLVSATGSQSLASTGAVVAAPPVAPLLAGALALVAVGVIAAVLLVRRRREDDLELALLAMEERRWNDALPRLARVAKRRPDDAGVHVDRALCLEQVGRLEEAAKAFETALRAAPRHAEAHFYYARTLARMHEREAARVHLETALERDPRLVELLRREQALQGL